MTRTTIDPRVETIARELHGRYRSRGSGRPWSRLPAASKAQFRQDAQFVLGVVLRAAGHARVAKRDRL